MNHDETIELAHGNLKSADIERVAAGSVPTSLFRP